MREALLKLIAAGLASTPPRACTANTIPHGQVVVIPLGPPFAFGSINLRALVATYQSTRNANQLINTYETGSPEAQLALGAPPGGPGGGVGSFITVAPEGTDVGILFGPTQVAVDFGPDEPLLTTTGLLDGAGNYTGAPKTCWRVRDQLVAPYPPPRYKLQRVQDEWMGFCVPTGVAIPATALLRLYISSEAALVS